MVAIQTEPEFDLIKRLLDRRRRYAIGVFTALVFAAFGVALFSLGVPGLAAAWALVGIVLTALFGYAWKIEPERLVVRAERAARKAGIIETSDDALSVTSASNTVVVPWSEIIKVTVFKRDLFATDLICAVFELRDGRSIEIHEELIGWSGLTHELPTRLSGAPKWEEWWSEVAFPAFKPQPKRLWQRVAAG